MTPLAYDHPCNALKLTALILGYPPVCEPAVGGHYVGGQPD